MMKKATFFFLVIATLTTTFYSCKTNTDDLWDSIHQLDGRVTSLEELCKQMNGNISSLQKLVQALQDNNSITMVTPVKQGDKTIGYTISFTKGEPITIYHGEKGDKGEQGDKGETGDKGDTGNNGKDGTTPTIGVKQHADGIYYWTLNGDWLRDNSGNMIKAEGKDGADGEQGEEGKAGTTPQLKIEDGYWWVSYGEESGWIQLDKAVADNGETIFKEVTQDDNYVYFTLKDETVITIQKYRKLSITFKEGDDLKFDVDETKVIHYTIKSESAKSVIKVEMLNNDGCYSLHTDIANATSGTITIKASVPTTNQVIVSVSNGEVTIMAAINVSLKPALEENTIRVSEAGTLAKILEGYDKNTITTLRVIGSLDKRDINVLKELPQLAILDLENVYMPKLPDDAFADKKTLTSIMLPKTLKEIGAHAFATCSGLIGDLIIPANVTTIGECAYMNCTGFTGKLIIPATVNSIGEFAFSGCSGLTGNLIIPKNINTINYSTFRDCSGLTGDLVIPTNIISIGEYAFYGCSGFTGKLIISPNVTLIGEEAFSQCKNLTGDLTIPTNVISIGDRAFYFCTGFIGKLTLPAELTTIGEQAFAYCSNLTGDLIIPSSVTIIRNETFYRCFKFTGEIRLPSNLVSIGESAFYCGGAPIYCNALIPPVLKGDKCFLNKRKLYVPKGCVENYRSTEGWNKFESIEEVEF